eukprot:351579-Chlamydomonas_euryale.AAC.3
MTSSTHGMSESFGSTLFYSYNLILLLDLLHGRASDFQMGGDSDVHARGFCGARPGGVCVGTFTECASPPLPPPPDAQHYRRIPRLFLLSVNSKRVYMAGASVAHFCHVCGLTRRAVAKCQLQSSDASVLSSVNHAPCIEHGTYVL